MSRFVTAGTNDEYAPSNDEWAKAEQQIQESKKPRPEIGQQEGGKSLYEVLQANKAAKQEAFEEKNKLKNQFRSLDDDEVDFLDAVLESTRAQEASVKKETSEQLEAFRKQQDETQKAALDAAPKEEEPDDLDQWAVSRKRKRARDRDLHNGLKLRKASSSSSSAAAQRADSKATGQTSDPPKDDQKALATSVPSKPSMPIESQSKDNISSSSSQKAAAATGLVAYGSDSDE